MDVSRGDARHVALLGTRCSSMSWLVAQVPPGYPCPHVASGQPARWMNVSGDTDLLPTAILPQCCCCIAARWSGDGWFVPIVGNPPLPASITQRASSAGSVTEMRSPLTGLGLFAMKKMKPKPPSLFVFIELWHKQKAFSPDEFFSLQQQPK